MTRCNLLDTWFDSQSSKLDELNYNIVTGKKNPLKQRLDKFICSTIQYMGGV